MPEQDQITETLNPTATALENHDGGFLASIAKGEEAVPGDTAPENEGKKPGAEAIISARDLDFIYNRGKQNEFHALRNISLDIYPEEFVIIFGPSGCGKSTLLNVMAGLETPDKGSMIVLGRDLTKMDAHDFAMYHRTQIGMIYQAYNLITSLTVLENVVLPQIFLSERRSKRNQRGRELLERFGIATHADKIPTELSGGQQQRIGIARSIVNDPQIILADEPMGNLDSNSAKIALGILGELNENEKKTIIMVTHNPEHLDFADRILYMKDGVIVREVVNRDRHKRKEIDRPKSALNEINELMRAYQGLTPEQINILIMPFKSKVFAHHFLSTKNMEETRVFEEAIQRRLLGTIDEQEFYEVLDKPSISGGVGYDKRTAKHILDRVNRVTRMAYFAYQRYHQAKDENGFHAAVTLDEKSEGLCEYLLDTCYAEHKDSLDPEKRERIRQAISDRLGNLLDRNGFYQALDKPMDDGGAGLNAKTAKAISEELELVMILGFGVVGAGQKSKYTAAVPDAHGEHPEAGIADPGKTLGEMESQLQQEIRTPDATLKLSETPPTAEAPSNPDAEAVTGQISINDK